LAASWPISAALIALIHYRHAGTSALISYANREQPMSVIRSEKISFLAFIAELDERVARVEQLSKPNWCGSLPAGHATAATSTQPKLLILNSRWNMFWQSLDRRADVEQLGAGGD
jgi:hypothetical protein